MWINPQSGRYIDIYPNVMFYVLRSMGKLQRRVMEDNASIEGKNDLTWWEKECF